MHNWAHKYLIEPLSNSSRSFSHLTLFRRRFKPKQIPCKASKFLWHSITVRIRTEQSFDALSLDDNPYCEL